MKIAFAEKFLYSIPRGIERTTFSLANALAQQGHDVTLITPQVAQKNNAVDPLPMVDVHFIPVYRYYQHYHLIPFYLKDFAQNQYDMIFISFGGYGEGIAVRLAHLLWGQKYCIHLHFPVDEFEHRYSEFKRFGISTYAHRILAASQYVAQQAERYLEKPCIPNPNGVDINHFTPPVSKDKAKASLGFSNTDKIMLSIAALEERKGVQKVILAMRQVLKSYPEAKFIVLGEGPYRPKLEAMISELKLEEAVYLKGIVSDVLPFYHAADVFILLAEREANSIAVYEAWACGLPVITERGDAYAEVVRPDIGQMVNGLDKGAVTNAILHFLDQSSVQRDHLAKQTRRYVRENFTWSVAADSLIQSIS